MKTTTSNSEFNTLSPGQKILLSAAAFAVLGSFISFMVFGVFGNSLNSTESIISGFTVFIISGMYAALIPVVLGRTYYTVTHTKSKK